MESAVPGVSWELDALFEVFGVKLEVGGRAEVSDTVEVVTEILGGLADVSSEAVALRETVAVVT